MRVLVTAGGTDEDIDAIRSITNNATGRTGEKIARYFRGKEHDVTILTADESFSNRDDILKFRENLLLRNVKHFRTYDELKFLIEKEIRGGKYDVVIHSAAVSDWYVAGVFASNIGGAYHQIDNSTKIKTPHDRLSLELLRTEKIVDKIRDTWGFKGKLVKFKHEMGVSDEKLIEIATKSMHDSKADFIVANCDEWKRVRAIIVSADGSCQHVTRDKLPEELLKKLTEEAPRQISGQGGE
ncbi:MAG: phosphopantothenoylcysteine decarboxylase [bacterium]|nr:phosphopantothenoylcysteine decarboxylase [bacterium]